MPLYDEIESIISEYDRLKQQLNPNSSIMGEFPKMLLMSIVSLFENQIKSQLSQIITKVEAGTLTSLPNILELSNSKRTSDFLYKKFYTYRNQMENLTAQPFYYLFGGQAFVDDIKSGFNEKLSCKLILLEDQVNNLLDLATKDSKFEELWIEKVDEKDILVNLNFEEAERSFLCLKLRRNRLAHDYINGLSDTFGDINIFYRKSHIYVSALNDCLSNLH